MKPPVAVKTARPERPTLKTISRISGLAMTTVSRALGDAPDISAATKEKVRQIAREVGYVPNRAGVRLRTGRTNVISLVLATEHDTLNMTSSLIAAISEGLQGTPFHLVMIPEPPGQDPLQAIQNIVENRSADAIIFNRIESDDRRVAYLKEQGFPFVTHGRSSEADSHSFFDFDNRAFGRLAVATLAARGRSHILLLPPPLTQNYAKHILEGASEAAQHDGVVLQFAEGISSDSSNDETTAALSNYLNTYPECDALLSASPNATMVAARAIEMAGRTIGEDFDIFTKETIPFLHLFRPQILSIREDVTKAGRFLAKAAVFEISNTKGSAMQKLDVPFTNEETIPPDSKPA